MRVARRGAMLGLPALLTGQARAAAPITLLSGAPPGSGAEQWVRSFAPFLERHWPGSVVRVVALPGERGLLAARAIAEAGPGVFGVVATPQLLARLIEADARDLLARLAMVAAVVEEPLVLLVRPQDPPEPETLRGGGPTITLGTPPAGSAAALAARALAKLGAAVDPLAFANAAAARKAVATGSIPAAMLALPDAIAALREGRLTAIGVAQATRTALLPDTPTLAELGLPVTMVGRRGIVAPRGASTERLDAALATAAADPEFAAQADELGYLPRRLERDAWRRECDRLLRSIAIGDPALP